MTMENKNFNPFEKLSKSIRSSVTIKLLSIGILILLLMIPVSQVQNLINEREGYRQQVVDEVSEKWGGEQTIVGPILTIPYKELVDAKDNTVYEYIRYAHFLPSKLDIQSSIKPDIRRRGIYEVALYNATSEFTGVFQVPNFDLFDINPELILWEEAFISVGIPDMAGINSSIELLWNKNEYSFEPGVPTKDVIVSGISARLNVNEEKENSFAFSLDLNGSKSYSFVPVGKETSAQMESSWKNPSFSGRFLPDDHHIGDKGFSATWKVFDFNRNYPQQWLGTAYDLSLSVFGVDLFMPINHYQKNMRSAKYAFLIIALSFLVYFFFEILNKRRIHPFQYILVGLSLSIFYVLLLSFTEHIGFDSAYAIAAIMVIALIVGYSSAIFKSKRLTILLSLFLLLIYSFIYVILQLQDYSLLVGSIGLFIVLSITMYLSRKIDWYDLSSSD